MLNLSKPTKASSTKLKKVDNIHLFWKWWSVQLGVLTTALGAAATAYGGLLLIDRELVSGMPPWFGVVITLGTTVTAFLSVYARRFAQPNLENSNAGEVSQDQEVSDDPGQAEEGS